MQSQHFVKRCLVEITNDWPIHTATLIAATAASLTARAYGIVFRPDLYIALSFQIFSIFIATYVFCGIIIRSIHSDPTRPFSSLPIGIRQTFSPRLIATFIFLCELPLLGAAFTTFKFLLPRFGSYSYDHQLAYIDVFLHGKDPWLLIQPLIGTPIITRLFENVYGLTWFIATVLTPVLVSLLVQSRPLRLQYIFSLVFCWFLLGNLLALIFLSAGPCYYGEFTGDFERFGYIQTYLTSIPPRLFSANDLQHLLLELFRSGRTEIGSGISAFPSLHVATATLTGCLLWQTGNVMARTIGIVYVALVLLASVHLGWHYAIDGYFSITAVMLIWAITGWLIRRLLCMPKDVAT